MSDDPKLRLIISATAVFAENGYKCAKVVDIVKGAKANIAAINYHFGSKENLFIASLRHAFATAEETYPVDGNLPKNSPPLKRIEAFARALLCRCFDHGPAGDFNRIMCQNFHSPGSPIERIIKEVRAFEHHNIEASLKLLLPSTPDTVIETAKMNIISIATLTSKFPMLAPMMIPKKPSKKDIAEFIDSQLQVCLATLTPLLP